MKWPWVSRELVEHLKEELRHKDTQIAALTEERIAHVDMLGQIGWGVKILRPDPPAPVTPQGEEPTPEASSVPIGSRRPSSVMAEQTALAEQAYSEKQKSARRLEVVAEVGAIVMNGNK